MSVCERCVWWLTPDGEYPTPQAAGACWLGLDVVPRREPRTDGAEHHDPLDICSWYGSTSP